MIAWYEWRVLDSNGGIQMPAQRNVGYGWETIGQYENFESEQRAVEVLEAWIASHKTYEQFTLIKVYSK